MMLSAQNLSCRRGGRTVFTGIEFTVESGGFLLVAGANGSGKSSLLRVLAGLIEPTDGSVGWYKTLIGDDPAAHRGRVHYVGHLDATKPHLTVAETLAYWRALRGDGDINAAMDAFSLRELAHSPVRRLSAGQRRRLNLSRLALDTAPLWLLDEPATALDKNGQEVLRACIARHRAQGGVVVAASHDEVAAPNTKHFDMPCAV
jgi:heme exporter protein A